MICKSDFGETNNLEQIAIQPSLFDDQQYGLYLIRLEMESLKLSQNKFRKRLFAENNELRKKVERLEGELEKINPVDPCLSLYKC